MLCVVLECLSAIIVLVLPDSYRGIGHFEALPTRVSTTLPMQAR